MGVGSNFGGLVVSNFCLDPQWLWLCALLNYVNRAFLFSFGS